MKIIDFPNETPLYDKFKGWTKSHESDISKALSDGFKYHCATEIDYQAKEAVTGLAMLGILAVVIIVTASYTFTIGVAVGFAAYFCVYLFAKSVAKSCAISFFEKDKKEEILRKCFEEILKQEFDEATDDKQREAINEFFTYAISHYYEINFKYTK